VFDPATSAQELSLPATPTPQPAIWRLEPDGHPGSPFFPGFSPFLEPGALELDLFDLLGEDLPLAPAVMFTAAQDADMAANALLESIAPVWEPYMCL
jgi:hypothetical protein